MGTFSQGAFQLLLILVLSICRFSDAESLKDAGSASAFLLRSSHRYSWTCREEICTKVLTSDLNEAEEGLPFRICKLTCGHGGSLWPLPTGKVEIGKGLFNFYPQNVEFGEFEAEDGVQKKLNKSSKIFRNYLKSMYPDDDGIDEGKVKPVNKRDAEENKIRINIAVVYPDSPLKLGIDESYTLSLVSSADGKTVQVTISANTFYGARHALETLSQLMAFNEFTETLTIVDQAIISDKPFYMYRGILLDTSRNFIPFSGLKRLIDGLSYNKLNFFHWHMTDTHSFPFESKRHPVMTEYGAYSARQTYSVAQMKELVEYGTQRGVKVLPELDAPAHVGNGWEWGPSQGLGNLAVCMNKEPWFKYCVQPPCGQLNPANEKMYDVLGDLYKDFLDIFENDIFHMGGDEVFFACWNSTDEITKWMIDNGYGLTKEDFIDVWGKFQEKAYRKLKEANANKDLDAILWTSDLASESHTVQYLSNSTYIIQIWSNGHEEAKIIPFLIQNGYRTIFSQVDPWYFDCGFGAWIGNGPNNWCSPYKGWQQVYMNNPITILANTTGQEYAEEAHRRGLILGGEAVLWTEQADVQSMEMKIWPRGSALAERLWTNPKTGWYASEPRMLDQRERFVDRGLRPDALQPQWCHQNDKGCPPPE